MRRSQWTVDARGDLAAIDDYYHDLNPDHALRVGRAAIAAARFLAERPEAGPVLDDKVRKWRVRGTDYVLIYRPVRQGIQVLRVHHAKQNWRKAE
ncbi:MAG: type II toxin-antitoxin system RelE/ParE family toxin [Sphingomonas sp.]|jgi:plasmid stabilization system protein ParE|uniref:type II toxin-antitoxin system RelE/ParE family toxin n=1 Tax=Sphingomonas sp. TaxID=28214 RepID=UPI003566C9F3